MGHFSMEKSLNPGQFSAEINTAGFATGVRRSFVRHTDPPFTRRVFQNPFTEPFGGTFAPIVRSVTRRRVDVEQAIQAFDWTRIILGDEPPLFLLEIGFRTALIYIYALVLLRWLGSRTIGQLSTVEFLLVIALGSAVGDAMFYPDVPLAHALLVITIVVLANKLLDVVIARNAAAEEIIDGTPEEAVRDGAICRGFLKGNTLSDNELFQQLREKGIAQLGEVAHAYLETDGAITVFKAKDVRPGLPIMPPWDIEAPEEVKPMDADGPITCRKCGTIGGARTMFCTYCNHDIWVKARL